MKWPLVSRRLHEREMREWKRIMDFCDAASQRSLDQTNAILNQLLNATGDAASLRAEANTMLGWLVSLKVDLANHFGPYFVDGKATSREQRTEIRSNAAPIVAPVKPEAPTAPMSFDCAVAGVGLVPGRGDRLLSLHVGPCHTLLSCEEAKELADQMRVMDRRGWGSGDNGNRRRRSDPR